MMAVDIAAADTLRNTAKHGRKRFPRFAGLMPLAILLGVWQLAGSTTSASFPVPSTWVTAVRAMFFDGSLLPALGNTLSTFAISLIVALVFGVAVGTLVGSFRLVERGLAPSMDFFRALPPPVVVTVAGLVLGITYQAGVVVVVLSVIWPILLNTVSAVKNVPVTRIEMARSVGLSRRERYLKVLLPSLIPGIVVGLKISLSMALVVTLLVDLLGGANGIGRLLLEKQQVFDASSVWAILLIIGVVGFLLNAGITVLERRLLRNMPPP